MLRKTEKSAKSKEEALKLAAEELGVSVEELSYEVERETGKGLLGFLVGREVVVSAWVTKEAEKEEKIKEAARKRAGAEQTEKGENPYAPKSTPFARDLASDERKKKKPVKEAVSADVKKVEKTEVKLAGIAVKEAVKPVENSADAVNTAGEVKETKETKETSKPKKVKEVTEQSLKDAEYFVSELIHKMGLPDAKAEVKNGGSSVDVDISGEKMGLLIGKRGDTLNSIQYLTSLYVNRSKNSYIKVNVDTENYRAKREETLTKLAKSLERRVLREGAAVTLEPMSPNERRIIHAALQDSNDVKTYSVGEEPNRKVIVALK